MGFDVVPVFLVLGLILVILEFLIPGLVVVFLGLAALIVAGGAAVGLITGWVSALTAWSVLSLFMTLVVRSAFTRFLPGTSVRQLTDEDLDAFGEVVDVVETVTTLHGGRIRFRGSTWAAQTVQEELPVGSRARVVARDNLVWIVEPLDGWAALPAPATDAEPDAPRKENA